MYKEINWYALDKPLQDICFYTGIILHPQGKELYSIDIFIKTQATRQHYRIINFAIMQGKKEEKYILGLHIPIKGLDDK